MSSVTLGFSWLEWIPHFPDLSIYSRKEHRIFFCFAIFSTDKLDSFASRAKRRAEWLLIRVLMRARFGSCDTKCL